MVPVRFIEDALKNLEDFHNIEDADAKTLENFSGIPQLWRHVNYIGEQKADTEMVNSVIGNCEGQFAEIKTAFAVKFLQDISEEDKKRLEDLERKIIDLKNVVNNELRIIENITGNSDSLRAAKGELADQVEDIKRQAVRNAKEKIDNIIKNAPLEDSDVKQIQAEKRNANMDKLMESLGNQVTSINSDSSFRLVKLIQSEGTNFSKKVEEVLQNAQKNINKETERVKKSIGGDNVAANMIQAFTLPQFPISLKKLYSSFKMDSGGTLEELSSIAKNSNRIETETRTRREKRDADGFWEHVKFWNTYYKDVNYDVDVAKADAKIFKANIKGLLKDQIVEAIDNSHEEMKSDVKQKITDIYMDVQKQCKEIGKNYQNILERFEDDIHAAKDETSEHKKAIEHDIKILIEIENHMKPFFDLWNKIKPGDKKCLLPQNTD